MCHSRNHRSEALRLAGGRKQLAIELLQFCSSGDAAGDGESDDEAGGGDDDNDAPGPLPTWERCAFGAFEVAPEP